MEKMENNGENSGPLTSLPVNRPNSGTCNADARASTSPVVKGAFAPFHTRLVFGIHLFLNALYSQAAGAGRVPVGDSSSDDSDDSDVILIEELMEEEE